MLYEFKQSDAFDFASKVGIKVKPHGDELTFSKCPYCKGGKGNDKDTFSINLRTGQFKCLRSSCSVSGNMITLSRDFDFSLGTEIDNYYKPKKYRQLKKRDKPIVPKPKAIQYLASRGISQAIAEKYEITVRSDNDNVIVFPFYDEKNDMQIVKYRNTMPDPEKKLGKEWCEKNCKPILFGIKQAELSQVDTLIICEGQIDTLSVAECGYDNCVSVPFGKNGFTWIPYCWDWIHGKFKRIIVFGDYERGQISLLNDIHKRFSALTVKHVREEDYLDCKDANDILRKYGKEQIKKCIENAVAVPIKDVIDLSEVKALDVFEVRKLETGLHDLDRLLYGGLPFGGIHLITGKAGEGKSTLASQIIVNAREKGHKCFCYSGELPNALFRAWMDFQVAGIHVFDYQNRFGDSGYNISQVNKDIISGWYREHIWLYDTGNLNGEEEHDSLIKTTEKMINQYGCDVVLLDNLMTAIDFEAVRGDDKYDRQSRFIKKLANLARNFNVCILLVAHKRKNNFSTNINDEVAGSSDISNLAMTTLSYEREGDLDDDSRKLKVSKNRLFGKTYTKGWTVRYDERSKRIYGENDDYKKDFSCFKDTDGFSDINEVPPWESEV